MKRLSVLPWPFDDTDLYVWLYLDGLWGKVKFGLAYLLFFGVPLLCKVAGVIVLWEVIKWSLSR